MSKRQSDVSPRMPADARVQRSKEAVLKATYQLLTEAGLGGVSVDAVSERSGVAKTTIYRHWPSRSALMLDACANLGSPQDVPNTGDLEGDLLALAMELGRRLRTAPWASILPSIIDAAERDSEVAEVVARNHAAYMAAFRAVIDRAPKSDAPRRGREASQLIAAIVGPLYYRRWFSREPLDERFIRTTVTDALQSRKRRR